MMEEHPASVSSIQPQNKARGAAAASSGFIDDDYERAYLESLQANQYEDEDAILARVIEESVKT